MQYDNSFALIGHITDINMVHDYMSLHKEDYKAKPMSNELLEKLFEWTPAFKAFDIDFKSAANNKTISGIFVLSTFLPDALLKSRKKVISKIEEAVHLSDSMGATVSALGGFTSIADNASGAIVAKAASKMRVTNGTASTSIMTVEGIKKLCDETGIDLAETTLSIIGATGSVGRTCAAYFRNRVKRLILTGRNINKLNHFFGDWQNPENTIIELASQNQEAISEAEIVIFVTSSTKTLCSEEEFKPGAIVCDVGFPKNVITVNLNRDDIIIYAGGLAQPPGEMKYANLWGLPSNNMIYGCFAEAIAIAMEGCFECCSTDSENIPIEKLRKIKHALFKHGFIVPHFMNMRKVYSTVDFENIKNIVRKKKMI